MLVSWAIPRGVPKHPGENHLAVSVEDHPLSYIDFSGEIPKGSYGAGAVSIWDNGTYECEEWADAKVKVILHGGRLNGRYALFRTKEPNWMIHRMDPPEDPGYQPPPAVVEPMRALSSDHPPKGDSWSFELKWDGMRVVAFVESGVIRLQGRSLKDVTDQYPELRSLGESLADHDVVLDGEVVALDEEGRPSFRRLQQRMNVGPREAARRISRTVPVTYMVFDVLYADGRMTTGLPYAERRSLLQSLDVNGALWQTPSAHVGDGPALLASTRDTGLEGLVAKRVDSPYESGRRSRSWLKIKNFRRQEFLIGGWLPGEGRRSQSIGALLVGYYSDGGLRYAGRVGSGFSDADLETLKSRLAPLEQAENVFEEPPVVPADVRRQATFTAPTLMAEVSFSEWTGEGGGVLRQPSYKGLRDDKDPKDVHREA